MYKSYITFWVNFGDYKMGHFFLQNGYLKLLQIGQNVITKWVCFYILGKIVLQIGPYYILGHYYKMGRNTRILVYDSWNMQKKGEQTHPHPQKSK